MTISQDSSVLANMNSPQGALDIAGITPGKYEFAEKKRNTASPAEVTVSSLRGIVNLMRQATETAALLPKEPREQARVATVPLSDLDVAFKVVCTLPKPITDDKPLIASARPKENSGKAEDKSAPQKGASVSNMIGPSGLQWPVDGVIFSTFNAPRGKKRLHGAIDIVTKRGTPISAAADGTVSVVANGGKGFSGYGKVVIIDHGKGIHTLYSHCDTILVKMGQRVKRGDYLATVGSTGRATTNHVHFEVRVAGKKQDPLKLLPSRPEMVRANNYKSPKSKGN
ncbi:MAG: M23 family metallopeptidase [Synergistaceae bacterium]|jgi:murein DD-endopeptidase MepM/ murein hydrolase activator NlpD|nr:M23 family metallopeptidase [Synergistaceae bacterium]